MANSWLRLKIMVTVLLALGRRAAVADQRTDKHNSRWWLVRGRRSGGGVGALGHRRVRVECPR
ncbi:hypothetical protein ACFTZB_40465, partial [Rhodococcus sp. NPDC057014]|uniref:hypothetical protein n=1 Tax=Rhodococcus sp. NPDC057014 TaxID=3346000 RepID=UPI00363694BF